MIKDTNANTEMTEKLELPGKKLKSSTTKKLQQAIMNKLETNERLESLRKEIEKSQQRNKRYKKGQVVILEPRNTITRMKKTSVVGLTT